MKQPINGYIPGPTWWKNIIKRVIGDPNPLKRLQLPDIFRTLSLRPDDLALDFGCSSGYMTYEMARRCRKAYGIDIIDLSRNRIPVELADRLEFKTCRGERTPFDDRTFDVILMSEVVPMIADPRDFFAEVTRILKPAGRIVLLNPIDRQAIRRDYDRNSGVVKLMRAFGRAPADYTDYTTQLQRSFHTALKQLPPESYYHRVLGDLGYYVEQVVFTPSAAAQALFERVQFIALCMNWPTFGPRYFLLYPILWAVNKCVPGRRGTGCLMVARRTEVCAKAGGVT
jgi:SAM-dependent methyltransferase